MLNYLLPNLERQGKLTIAPVEFMWWSDGPEVKQISLEKVMEGTAYKHLIHWAGVTRIPNLDKMTRPDILHFFQDYYYSKVPTGNLKKQARMLRARTDYYLRQWYRATLKPLLKK